MNLKKIIPLMAAIAAVTVPQTASAGLMHYYRDSGGAVYKICRDSDGYTVYKPDGGRDQWGTGYSWSDVKSRYGLGKWYTRGGNFNPCP